MKLAVNGLSYERNKKLLFNQLTFQVYPGEALHILGPNGAGKTSLLQILTGLIPPFSGNILCNGIAIHNSSCFKKKMLYVSHRLGMKSVLTPFENLYLFLVRRGFSAGDQSLKQVKQQVEDNIYHALHKLDLHPYLKILTGSLSAGQQQRLILAKLLLIKVDCWILDEPLTALDSKGIHFVSLLIEEQLCRGGLVIFTSHQPLSLSHVKMKRLFLGASRV